MITFVLFVGIAAGVALLLIGLIGSSVCALFQPIYEYEGEAMDNVRRIMWLERIAIIGFILTATTIMSYLFLRFG